MKKVLYFALLLVEFLVGFYLMSLVWAVTWQIPCIITAVVCAALLIWQIVLLTKATDDAAKRKIKRNIALVMLIPTVVFIVLLVWFIVALSSVI